MRNISRHFWPGPVPRFPVLGVVLALAFVLVACGDAVVQDGTTRPATAELTGQVHDADSQPVPGVRVLLQETGRTSHTDAQGWFRFGNLEPGMYSLHFSKADFGEFELQLALEAGETRAVDDIVMPDEKPGDGGKPPADDDDKGAEDETPVPGDDGDESPAPGDEDEDDGGEEPANEVPALTGPEPEELNLSGRQGKTVEASLEIGNEGTAVLTYSFAARSGLEVAIEPEEGQLEAGETVSVGLEFECTADASGSVQLTTNDSERGSVSIPVVLTCAADDGSGSDDEPADPVEPPVVAPELGSVPVRLSLTGVEGSTVRSQLQFRNAGTADLDWDLTDTLGLTLQPRTGTLRPGTSATVQVSGSCTASSTGSIRITSNDPDRPQVGIPVTRTCAPAQPDPEPGDGSFNIELEFVGNVPQSYRQAISNAAARWSEIITDGLAPVRGTFPACNGHPSPGSRTVNNLLISIKLEEMAGNTLGYGGFCAYRNGSNLPAYGTVTLNTGIDTRFGTQALEQAALHEIGHVLGLGTMWDHAAQRHIDYAPAGTCRNTGTFTRLPRYTSPEARSQFAALTGAGAGQGVPLESNLGPGSRCGHWDAGALPGEVMVAVLQIGRSHNVSRVTVGSLADLGYAVDYSKADQSYRPSALGTAGLTGETVHYDGDFTPTEPVPMD